MSRNHRRLPTGAWGRFRLEILRRDHYLCRECGRAGRLEVDHIIPLDKGGEPWEAANCQSLCRGCHIEKTAAENTKGLSYQKSLWRKVLHEELIDTTLLLESEKHDIIADIESHLAQGRSPNDPRTESPG